MSQMRARLDNGETENTRVALGSLLLGSLEVGERKKKPILKAQKTVHRNGLRKGQILAQLGS